GAIARMATTAPFGQISRQSTSMTPIGPFRPFFRAPVERRRLLASVSSPFLPKPPSSRFEHLRQTRTTSFQSDRTRLIGLLLLILPDLNARRRSPCPRAHGWRRRRWPPGNRRSSLARGSAGDAPWPTPP